MIRETVWFLGVFVLTSAIIIRLTCPFAPVNACSWADNYIGEVNALAIDSHSIMIQTHYHHQGSKGWTPHEELMHVSHWGANAMVNALDGLEVGDYVEVGCSSPGNYVALAKLVGAANRTVTDIYGSPRSIHTPLLGGYEIDYTITPDLHDCTTRYCPAKYADIEIQRLGSLVATRRLWPGETFYYHGEACNITVTFHSGLGFNPDPIWKGWAGPQMSPSDFTVHLTSENIPLKNELIDPAIIATTTVTLVAISAIMIMDFRKKRRLCGVNSGDISICCCCFE